MRNDARATAGYIKPVYTIIQVSIDDSAFGNGHVILYLFGCRIIGGQGDDDASSQGNITLFNLKFSCACEKALLCSMLLSLASVLFDNSVLLYD